MAAKEATVWEGKSRRAYHVGDRVRLSRRALICSVHTKRTRDAVGTVTKVERARGWTYFVRVKWDRMSVPQEYAAAYLSPVR